MQSVPGLAGKFQLHRLRFLLNLATASLAQHQLEYVPYKQVLGLYWSWKRLGSPGMFTRIACCEFDRLKVLMLAAACMCC